MRCTGRFPPAPTALPGLEALGVDQITYSTIVVPMLMEKIPEGVRFNMIRSTEKKQINTAFQRGLGRRATFLEDGG